MYEWTPTGKTQIFEVCANDNSNTKLGMIKWRSGWRKYAFFPQTDTLFESQCLRDIATFLDQLMIARNPPCNCFALPHRGERHMPTCPKARKFKSADPRLP
jgi:hypothetical protein